MNLLKFRGVFLKDLEAIPLQCYHQEGGGLGIRVSVGGQNSNFNSCQQQTQLGPSIHTDQPFVSFPPSPLSPPPYALILPSKTPSPAAWSAAELSSFPPVSGD